ncbi:MAG: RNA-binding protein [Luteitalea sp.]|nr:RNA-binding protein [Luteitalea sp.]
MTVRLFIGNLPYSTSEADLRELFAAVSEPTHVLVPVDRDTGRPRGFAFVDFPDRETAEEVIRRFNGHLMNGRPIAVSEARAREDRPSGPRPGPAGPRPGFGGPPGPGAAPPPRDQPGGPPRRERAGGGGGGGGGRSRTQWGGERGPRGPIKVRTVGRLYDDDEDTSATDEAPTDFDDPATSRPNDKDDEGEDREG